MKSKVIWNPVILGRAKLYAPVAKWEGIGFTRRQELVRFQPGVPKKCVRSASGNTPDCQSGIASSILAARASLAQNLLSIEARRKGTVKTVNRERYRLVPLLA